MSGPPLPPFTPLVASLAALQPQFAAFQGDLASLKSDVADALVQLDALRKAQNTTHTAVTQLEHGIGVPPDGRSRAHMRRRRVGGATAGGPDTQTVPEKTLFQRLASIEAALGELLARANPSPQPRSAHPRAHADSAVQTHLPPGYSYPPPPSWGYVPWFRPMYWNHSPPANSSLPSARPTAHTPEYLAQFFRDTHLPGGPIMGIDQHTSRGGNTRLLHGPMAQHYPPSTPAISSNEPAANNSKTPQPAVPSNDSSAVISVNGSFSATGTSSQTSPPAAEGASSSITSADTTLRASSFPTDSPAVHSEIASGADSSKILAPAAAETDEMTPCMLTPPSGMSTSDQERGIVPEHNPCSIHTQNLPITPTSPCRPSESLVGPAQQPAIQGPRNSLVSCLTPPPSAPGPPRKEGDIETNRPVEAPMVIDSMIGMTSVVVDKSTVPEEVDMDAPISRPKGSQGPTRKSDFAVLVSPAPRDDDARSDSHPGRVVSPEPTLGAAGVPIATMVHEPQSIAESGKKLHQVTSATTRDTNFPLTPTSPAGRTHTFSEHHPNGNRVEPTPALTNENQLDSSFSLQSCLPQPLTSATSSRYATPLDSPDLRLTQDEEEVWSALVLDESTASTPVPDADSTPRPTHLLPVRPYILHPVPTHTEVARVQSPSLTLVPEVLAIAPSMLHSSPAASHLQGTSGSLSPLTSLDDSDVDRPVTTQIDKGPNANALAARIRSRCVERQRRHRSEPYRPGSQLVGGPGASLNELAVLARRNPLKIHIPIPETLGSLKRKRDGADGEMGEAVLERSLDGERTHAGPAQDVVGRAGADATSASTPPGRMGQGSSVSIVTARHTPESRSRMGSTDNLFEVPRKRTKKGSKRRDHERLVTPEDAGPVEQNTRPTTELERRLQESFHFRRGQIVSVERAREQTLDLGHPASLFPESVRNNRDSRMPAQAFNDTRVMKTQSPQMALSGPSTVKPSPVKPDEASGTWPKLPIMFGQWYMQFILCDICEKWYHYGCVAIEPGDHRLEPEVSFTCPACCVESAGRQASQDHCENICARPDCPEPQTSGDSGHFFIERLVGRKRVDSYVFMWLAKWEGYPMTEATWIPKENVDGDGTKLCNTFHEDARKEGADLSREVVLLKEAIEAGWGDIMNVS